MQKRSEDGVLYFLRQLVQQSAPFFIEGLVLVFPPFVHEEGIHLIFELLFIRVPFVEPLQHVKEHIKFVFLFNSLVHTIYSVQDVDEVSHDILLQGNSNQEEHHSTEHPFYIVCRTNVPESYGCQRSE
jgi:hypothetical protein